MKISTKGRYALRVMIDLAINNNDQYVSLHDIATRQEISMKYLENIISVLNKAGLVESFRGKSGGYKLTKKPEDYKIGDILRTIEGSLAPVSCLTCKENTCKRKDTCLTLSFWEGLNDAINKYVDSYTLYDLIKNSASIKEIYCI